MLKIALFAVYFIILALHESVGICYSCNSNGVACASNNTFHLCFGGLPNLSEKYSCPNEDEVCTALGPVCMDPSSNPNIEAACGNTKQCGQCADVMDGGFTCTSRTTFTMCMGYALTDIRASCPIGQVCRTSVAQTGKVPCVNECLTDSNDMCDVSVAVDAPPSSESDGTTVIIQPTPPVDTTTTTAIIQPTPAINTTTTQLGTTAEPSVTSTTLTVSTNDATSVSPMTSISPVEFCASQTVVGRYTNPADNSCATYLYCSSSGSGSGLTAHIMQCPVGKFFDAEIRNCQSIKPNDCI